MHKIKKVLTTFSNEEENIILYCRKMFLYFEEEIKPELWREHGQPRQRRDLRAVWALLVVPPWRPHTQGPDGLTVVELPGPEVERLRKKVIKLFSSQNLQITTDANIKATDFLDVVFNLESNSSKPFRKDTSLLNYINCSSNHPTHITKELPSMISQRISALSSNQQTFNNEAPAYNQALKNYGYKDIANDN